MAKTVELCGETFELFRNRDSDYHEALKYEDCTRSNYCKYYRLKDIGQCYGRPSNTKRDIYSYWRSFFLDYIRAFPCNIVKHYDYGISGYNTNTFTFVCLIEFKPETRRPTELFTITKAHNRLALLDDFV